MNPLLLISYCLEVKDSGEFIYDFHFIGVYNGNTIEKIVALRDSILNIKKNDELVLYLNCLKVENRVMFTEIIFCRALPSLNLF